MKEIVKYLVLIAVWFAFGFLSGYKAHIKPSEPTVIRDTVTCIKYDTILREKPIYRTSYIYDTVRTYFTTIEHDTVLVDLPMERKVYEEDSLYRAVVTGYNPELEELLIYKTTKEITITNTVKTPPPRFTLGVTAGPSVLLLPKGEIKGGFGLTAGVTYNF